MLELFFAVLGIGMLITGDYPYSIFSSGNKHNGYRVTPKETRLFGLLLLAPMPATLVITILLALFLGGTMMTYLLYVEVACLLVIGFIVTRVAKKFREAKPAIPDQGWVIPPPLPGQYSGALPPPLPVTNMAPPSIQYMPHPNEEKHDRARMGLILTACLTGAIAFPLAMTAFGQFTTPSYSAGGFWPTYSIYIIGGVVVLLGVFGILFFARRMKQ